MQRKKSHDHIHSAENHKCTTTKHEWNSCRIKEWCTYSTQKADPAAVEMAEWPDNETWHYTQQESDGMWVTWPDKDLLFRHNPPIQCWIDYQYKLHIFKSPIIVIISIIYLIVCIYWYRVRLHCLCKDHFAIHHKHYSDINFPMGEI